MTLCNCDLCFCTEHESGRKAALCLSCQYGEHSAALREPNRFRVCRSCGSESRGLDQWPSACLGCGSLFGAVELGFDRVSEREAWSPMVNATEWAKALRAHRRAIKA